MDFLTKNNFDSIEGLRLKKTAPDESFFDLLLYTLDDKLIGCGKIDESFNGSELIFFDYYHKLHESIYENQLDRWKGLFFLVAEEAIWICAYAQVNRVGKRYTEIAPFLKNIKDNFPEVKSQIEREVDSLTEKTYNLERELDEAKAKSEHLSGECNKLMLENSKLKSVSKQFEQAQKKIEELEFKLKFEFVRDTISLDELSIKINSNQFNKILEKPFGFKESSFKARNGHLFSPHMVGEEKLNTHDNYWINDCSLNLEIDAPNIIVRLTYTFSVWLEGDKDVPSHWEQREIRRYYKIVTDGRVDRIQDSAAAIQFEKIRYTAISLPRG
jgi:regulator of replication initiation timing